jgi:glycosyltransferase involved in cell wall biosynthesis
MSAATVSPPRVHTVAVSASVQSSRPIRICFLIDELSRAGVETQLLALIERLDRSRFEPFLCLLRGDAATSRLLEPGDCPILRLGIASLRSVKTLGRLWHMVRFLRRERIDILQVHFPDSTYFGVLAGCLARVPHLIRTRDNLGYALIPLDVTLGKCCNRFIDFTIANCEACRRSLLADESPAPESVVVLPTGVDLARFARIPPLTSRAPHEIGILANLRPVKCLDLFLRAAAEVARLHPDAAFHLGGIGELRGPLERLAQELGLAKRCTFHGAVKDVPAFLNGLDICVLASRSEGMPNVILEYMASGRAIVATAVGAVPEMIDDGTHGLLVPPGDVPAMARALCRLLDDPGLAARLAAAARRRVRQLYDKDEAIERFEEFYSRLVRR